MSLAQNLLSSLTFCAGRLHNGQKSINQFSAGDSIFDSRSSAQTTPVSVSMNSYKSECVIYLTFTLETLVYGLMQVLLKIEMNLTQGYQYQTSTIIAALTYRSSSSYY